MRNRFINFFKQIDWIKVLFPIIDNLECLNVDELDEISSNNFQLSMDIDKYNRLIEEIKNFRKSKSSILILSKKDK